jgi:hypothetical protein
MMDHCDWDSVLQFVTDPLELDVSEKHAGDRTVRDQPDLLQVPTPPVSGLAPLFRYFSCAVQR